MINIIKIAFRNISRQKKRTILLGSAIAFGIIVITVINCFTTGTILNARENFTRTFGGHIFISGTEIAESKMAINVIRNDDFLKEVLEEYGIKYRFITKRSVAKGVLHFSSKSTALTIDGLDWNQNNLARGNLNIIEGNLSDIQDPKAIIIPKTVAEELNVQIGEQIIVRLSTVTGQENIGAFKVIALIEKAGPFGSESAFVNIQYLNELLNIGTDEFQVSCIYLEDMSEIEKAADIIYTGLKSKAMVDSRQDLLESDSSGNNTGGRIGSQIIGDSGYIVEEGSEWDGTKYRLTSLNDMIAPVKALITILNAIGLAVFVILIVITMVGISNTFRMIMLERVKEIGTLRAIGMQKNSVLLNFLLEALFISITGVIAGIIASILIMIAASFITFSSGSIISMLLHEGRLRFQPKPVLMFINIIILSSLSLIAAYFPAKKAANLDPAQAIRTQY